MASHGGMREGSGRPAGAGNKATSELKLNLSELAREYTNDALNTLVEVMQSSQSDSARIAATTASDLGFDIAKIGALLNHKKQNVTMGYIQSTIDAQRGILQAIEDAILHFDDPSDALAETDSSLGFNPVKPI